MYNVSRYSSFTTQVWSNKGLVIHLTTYNTVQNTQPAFLDWMTRFNKTTWELAFWPGPMTAVEIYADDRKYLAPLWRAVRAL